MENQNKALIAEKQKKIEARNAELQEVVAAHEKYARNYEAQRKRLDDAAAAETAKNQQRVYHIQGMVLQLEEEIKELSPEVKSNTKDADKPASPTRKNGRVKAPVRT